MGDIELKMRTVFVPYLLVAACFTLLYSLLHWLLIVGADVPIIDESVANVILPLALPWLVVVPWFRHRLKLLQWPKKHGAFVGYMIVWLTLAVPTIIAQDYLESAAGGLTQLERISQIQANPHTKYYQVRELTVDKSYARRWVRTFTSGRNSENWNMSISYAMPLLDPGASFDPSQSEVWLGVTYTNQVSNRLSQEDKYARLTALLRDSEQKLNMDDFRWISYLATIGRNKERQALTAALEDRTNSKVPPPIALLSAHAEPFASRMGSTLPWFFGTFSAGVGIWFLLAATVKVESTAHRQWLRREQPAYEGWRTAVTMFLPRAGFVATPILFDLNLLVWITMVFLGLGIDSISAAELMSWGAVHAANVQNGEIWRLLTSLFVHAGILHFFNNMISLVILGFLVEGSFGSLWFGSVYLLSGLAGSVGSMIWNPNLVSVGASGCIFGVAGFGLALLLLKRRRFASERPVLLKAAGVYLGLNLLLGVIIPGIDLVAHVVGLGCGCLIGIFASFKIRDI